MAGSPLKNTRRRIWTEAITEALKKKIPSGDIVQALVPYAEKMLERCDAGDIAAFKELADRLEGKATEYVNISGEVRELSDAELHALAARGSAGTAGEEPSEETPTSVH